MDKEELILKIGAIMELGLPMDVDEKNKHMDEMDYCVSMLDNYTTTITTRLRADFENETKRNKKEQEFVSEKITHEILSKFTEVIDTIDFFEDVVNDSNSEYVKTGYVLLKKKINRFLKECNIESVKTNIPFDSDLHECVSMMDGDKEKGTILKVASRGYKIGNNIIKYPKVIVQS